MGLPKKVAAMKATKSTTMKATTMTKSRLAAAIAEGCALKKGNASKVIATLASIGMQQVKNSGQFVIPGLVRIKTRNKPATKAAKKMMFGKMCLVKAKPAKTVVKAFPVKMLKDEF